MYLPPELMTRIASFLDAESCFACVSVSRYWKQVFTPHLWHTLNVSEQPWSRLFSPDQPFLRYPSHQRQHLARDLIRRHGHDIRVLEMDTAWLFWGSLLGHVNNLLSLTFRQLYTPMLEWPDMEFGAYSIESSEAIPYSIFEINDPRAYYRPDFMRLLACWHMVLNNKALRRLVFPYEVYDYFTLQAQEYGDHGHFDLTPEGKQFLINILSSLPDLRHMEIGQDSDSFLLISLSEHFPKLTSFVHLGTASLEPSMLLQPPKLHQSLQTLDFKGSKFFYMDAGSLRWIVTAFPGLRQLSVSGHFNGVSLDPLEGWHDIENHLITSFEVFDLSSMPTESDLSLFDKARIIFHAAKELKWTGEEYESPGVIFRTLRFFPALERFKFSSDAVLMDPLADGRAIASGDSVYRFKTLMLGADTALGLDIEQLLNQSPFLTRVELYWIRPIDVKTLADNCQALEYLHFNTYESCSLELNRLFVNCSELKECTGEYHLVEAIDILRSPHWRCLSLKKLDITIFYVPRAKGEQERMLEKAQRKLTKVRRKPRRASLHHVQDEGRSTHNSQSKSRRCQEKVLSKLAKLSQLQEIDFRLRSSDQWSHGGREFYEGLDLLEFTLESGLAELGGLDRLEKIAFKIDDDKFGQRERDWMWERWSMMEKPGEEGVFCVEDLM